MLPGTAESYWMSSSESTAAESLTTEFTATVRIDTPAEAAYYRHTGSGPTSFASCCAPTKPHKEPTKKVM
jgi:hypothetical protein